MLTSKQQSRHQRLRQWRWVFCPRVSRCRLVPAGCGTHVLADAAALLIHVGQRLLGIGITRFSGLEIPAGGDAPDHGQRHSLLWPPRAIHLHLQVSPCQ